MSQSPVPTLERATDRSSFSLSARVGAYIEILRPAQWIKNVVVLAAPAAGLQLASGAALARAGTAFLCFCLAASATYAINDVTDREADAIHPTKRSRPVARGAVPVSGALVLAIGLFAAAVVLSWSFLGRAVAGVLIAYFAMTLAYSLALKDHVILDVVLIAIGFVLRAWAGALAVGVVASDWLIACVFTLCLFMGFGKRRCENVMIASRAEAGDHRRTLLRYTPDLLNHLITVSAGIAVITFLLYTMDATGHPAPFHKQHLFYTLPLVVYGIFRFAMLTESGRFSGPTQIVLLDRPLLGVVLLWTVIALAIAYEHTLTGPGGFEAIIGVP